MSETEKLLPCPWCGSPGVMVTQDPWKVPDYLAMCSKDCDGGMTDHCDTYAEAAAQWNRRAPTPSPVDREAVARAHWESERKTLSSRSPGFDAGPWDDAEDETKAMRLAAADAVLALLDPTTTELSKNLGELNEPILDAGGVR